MPDMSARLVGIIKELLVLANLPNSPMYCSATRRFTASEPPSSLMAEAISRIPFAVASATFSISAARPSASLIRFCFSPSERAIYSCLSPSATFIFACFSPSDSAITARFSRSARICFSMASLMLCGGWIFLTS